VQETLVRVLAAAERIEPGMLEPYAIVTARNVIATMWVEKDRHRRNQHRVVDLRPAPMPDEDLLAQEEQAAVAAALSRLSERERETLVAHEVAGQDTRSLAAELGSSPGAVAAQLNRTRARLRVEYLLALEQTEPPSDRCRPVLLAISGGDRRRQRRWDAARHLLECDLCAKLSQPLVERGQQRDDQVRIPISVDADIVTARQAVRELAAKVGFAGTDLTLIATRSPRWRATSSGSPAVESHGRGAGRAAARTAHGGARHRTRDHRRRAGARRRVQHLCRPGPRAPGARRLMDEFAVASEVGRGTTVTMTKWLQEGRR
jgi:serine/threonine-protein kinase RsbT